MQDKEMNENIFREVKILNLLNHPKILRLFEVVRVALLGVLWRLHRLRMNASRRPDARVIDQVAPRITPLVKESRNRHRALGLFDRRFEEFCLFVNVCRATIGRG